MTSFEQQTITFAAICQVAKIVQQVSRTGNVESEQLSILLNSIVITSPDTTLEVYGGELSNLKVGLQTLIEHLGNDAKSKDVELTRYVVSLLGLERNLSRKPKQLALLGERIEQSQRQLAHFDITSDTITASLASIYSDLLSPLATPIQIAGEPEILKQTSNQHKIRALLLAGIRSAVLWRQLGGKRRNIIFSRSKLVDSARALLQRV